MAITVEDVKTWLRLDADDATDDVLLEQCVSATNAFVAGTPYVVGPPPLVEPWPDDVNLGATMLAARLYRRRNSPAGLELLDGGVVYTDRRDFDVDKLLHLGPWAPPSARVG